MSTEKYPKFMKGYVYPPTDLPDDTDDTPPVKLTLEHIYGSSRKGVKGDILLINKDKHIVYPTAACGVVLNPDTNRQKIFVKHNDDVKCIAMHPDGITCASGETGKDDMIYVWNSRTMEIISKIKSYKLFKQGGVIALSFSGDGKYLAAVGGSLLDSQLVLYNWRTGKVLGKTQCSKKLPYAMEWNPKRNYVIFCGKNNIRFFFVNVNSGKITAKNAIISSIGSLQSFNTVFFDDDGLCYVGTKDGSLYVFDDNKGVFSKKIHNGTIYSATNTPSGFVTGGRDGYIRFFKWTSPKKGYFKKEGEYDCGFSICSVVPKDDDCYYVWGKNTGSLSQIDLSTSQQTKLMVCHSGLGVYTELWGIDVIPKTPMFITAGDDGKMFLWNREKRFREKYMYKKGKWRSVSCSPNGKEFVVGSKSGKILVLSTSFEKEEIKSMQLGNEEIAVIRYSPCGKYLAVGSHTNYIYLLNAMNGYKKIGVLKAHTSFITALDFSADSQYIQSTSGDYELLYWDVSKKGKRVTSSKEMRDVKWGTQTCLLGWSIRGIWDIKGPQDDGTDINSIYTHYGKKIVVSVDDFGDVNVFKYPTLTNRPKFDNYIGHCSHTTRVRISTDGKYLFSTGGGDLTVFQWKID